MRLERSSKVRCTVAEGRLGCRRCSQRKTRCSYVPQDSRRNGPQSRESSQPFRVAQAGTNTTRRNEYRLTYDSPVLDIVRGRPQDLLREQEFAHSLLLLYFNHFSDVHFLFDEDLFLRDYAVGQVPEVLLFAIMALAIRYVPSTAAIC